MLQSIIESCFFNPRISDALQHIAVLFEITAIFMVWRDYQVREADLNVKGRAGMILDLPLPHPKRGKELFWAFVVGGIAVLMELYQLASQYLGCAISNEGN